MATIAARQRPGANDQPAEEDQVSRSVTRQVIVAVVAIVGLAVVFLSATAHAVFLIDDKSVAADIGRARTALSQNLVLDDEALDAIEETYRLEGVHLALPAEVSADEESLPTGRADGRVLAWTPWRMGTEVFYTLAPIRISAALLLIGAIGFVLFRLHALARHLEHRRAAAASLAVEDALTGVANRLGFNEAMAALLEEPAGPVPAALVLLDLDGFKSVNDRLGHLGGDQLLKELARRITAYTAPDDLVARLGGDEFAVIRRSGLDHEALTEFATDLIHLLSSPYRIGSRTARVSVSIGIARIPEDGTEADVLIHRADAALYRAKTQEGGSFEFAVSDQPLALVAGSAA